MRRVLCCLLALSVAACHVQHKVTVTHVYGPGARPALTPPPPDKAPAIHMPISLQIVTFVGGTVARVFSLLPHKKKLPAANPPPWVGTVRLVNNDERFVLIDGLSLSAARPGDTLITLSSHSESARLRMSNLTDPPFVIADIIDGKPQAGDKVYNPKGTLPMPASAPTPKAR